MQLKLISVKHNGGNKILEEMNQNVCAEMGYARYVNCLLLLSNKLAWDESVLILLLLQHFPGGIILSESQTTLSQNLIMLVLFFTSMISSDFQ